MKKQTDLDKQCEPLIRLLLRSTLLAILPASLLINSVLPGKRVQNASEEEEERYNDILIVMELLTNLLTKDFVDFGDGENG